MKIASCRVDHCARILSNNVGRSRAPELAGRLEHITGHRPGLLNVDQEGALQDLPLAAALLPQIDVAAKVAAIDELPVLVLAAKRRVAHWDNDTSMYSLSVA